MQPIVLAVLDGWGYSTKRGGNPISEAQKPTLDAIAQTYPMTLLQASGPAVGLAWGEFGNSEVGHLTIGAGRTVPQYATRIDAAIKDGSFFKNEAFRSAFSSASASGGSVHIVGLLTSGSVHAQLSHLLALLELARQHPDQKIFLHLFLDGKDSGLREGIELLKKLPVAPTSVIGRDIAMDRDGNWDRSQQTHDLIANAAGEQTDDIRAAIEIKYQLGINDMHMPPLVVSTYPGASRGDSVIFFNFREDSMRQTYQVFQKSALHLVSMTDYLPGSGAAVAFPPPSVPNHLAEVLSKAGYRQLHLSELTKYAHVTYFFNGLVQTPYPGEEDRQLQTPDEIARAAAAALQAETHDFILINFAEADVLAHTGNFEDTKRGAEAIDAAIGVLQQAVLEKNGVLVITADHGNAENMVDRISSDPESRHNESPVPLYLVSKEFTANSKPLEIIGILSDVAPTILELMAIPKPPEMTGVSLLPKLLDRGR